MTINPQPDLSNILSDMNSSGDSSSIDGLINTFGGLGVTESSDIAQTMIEMIELETPRVSHYWSNDVNLDSIINDSLNMTSFITRKLTNDPF